MNSYIRLEGVLNWEIQTWILLKNANKMNFSKGGLTEPDNCQMLCAKDNWDKAAR